jgi:cyclic pyranopterin phosphate synthase
MPEDGLNWLPKEQILTYEEIAHVAQAALSHGSRDFKLTGGEPLLRKDLPELVGMLRALPGCGEISLTTNGILLEDFAPRLKAAGVGRVTVSIDTLDADKFRRITRTGDLQRVLRGLERADACGLGPAKINVVVMRDLNLEDVADFAAMTRTSRRTVRFIEFMPLAESAMRDAEQFVPYADIRARIERAHGPLAPAPRDVGAGPANVFRLAGAAGRIGFVHAMSAPFCATCNRLRLTADGQLRSCLFDGGEVDVRALLRPMPRAAAVRRAFVDCVVQKPDTHQHYGTRQMSQIGG